MYKGPYGSLLGFPGNSKGWSLTQLLFKIWRTQHLVENMGDECTLTV